MRSIAFVLMVANAGVTIAQNLDDLTNSQCIARLNIPNYPALADAARITATVTTTAVLGPRGIVDKISSDISPHLNKSATAVFIKEVNESLRTSKFLAACSGRSVTLLFQFSLGEQVGTQRFSFAYPNRFEILAPVSIVNP